MSYHYLELAKWSSPISEPSPFMEAEEKKACIHEAGHAVVARLHGFRVEWVSVDHDFIKSDPSAIEVEIDYSSAVCLTRSSERVTPILAKRKVLTKGEKEIIIGY